jgi:hypothetical protein
VTGGSEGYCFVDSIYGSVDRSRDSPRWIPDEPEWGGLPEWDGGGDGRRRQGVTWAGAPDGFISLVCRWLERENVVTRGGGNGTVVAREMH